jgi:hypothetical protein
MLDPKVISCAVQLTTATSQATFQPNVAVIGAVAGALLLGTLACAVIYLYRRRGSHDHGATVTEAEPAMSALSLTCPPHFVVAGVEARQAKRSSKPRLDAYALH